MTRDMPWAPRPVELRTARLLLRPWQPGDAPAVLAACQDPQVQRWTRVPVPYTEDDARSFVEQLSPQAWASGTAAHFAVLDAADATVLASVSLVHVQEGSAEVGYWAAPGARGRGVVTEAVRRLCRWAFEELGLQRVEWLAYVGNDASRRVAEKVGFRPEGLLRSALVQRGRRHDAWIGGLLPTDLDP
jgi:RimJ/RimL family protein N-acetyltransferase